MCIYKAKQAGNVESIMTKECAFPSLRDSNNYLNFHMCSDAALFVGLSSILDTTDFEISSASEPGKLSTRDERKGSLGALDEVAVFDRYPLPPRRTCRWASRRSRPNKESA